jgi:hypothetical protein
MNFNGENRLDDIIPYFSREQSELFELHKNNRMTQESNRMIRETNLYNYVTSFRSDHVPDMISLVKKVDNYITYFDRKGRGLLIDINYGGNVISLSHIGNSEGSPRDVLLYKDTDGEPIILGYRYNDYGIWKCTNNKQLPWIECNNDYTFNENFGSKCKFIITTLGKMVLISNKGLYYVSFEYKTEPYRKYKIITEKVPEDDEPLYKVKDQLSRPDSEKRLEVRKNLCVDSIPQSHIKHIASKRYIRKPGTSYDFYQSDDYEINTVYSSHKYENILLVGHDGGYVSVWKC